MAETRSRISLAIANQQELLNLALTGLRKVGRTVLEGEGVKEARISLALVNDATIHRINRQFLQHDEPTDVISFPLSRPGARPLEGEIVISTETALAAAQELGHAAEHEVALYLIHGLLHLCGYDDHDQAERAKMRGLEAHYLHQLGIQLKDYPAPRKENPAPNRRVKRKRKRR